MITRQQRIKRFRRWVKQCGPDFKWMEGKVWINYRNYVRITQLLAEEHARVLSERLEVIGINGIGAVENPPGLMGLMQI